MRARLVWLLALVFAISLAVASAARAAEGPFSPELRAAMQRQDALTRAGRMAEVVQEARAGVSVATADAYYLLGRALGNEALDHQRAGREHDYRKALDDAREAFGRSKELGGLLFPPPLLGLARCARLEGDLQSAERELRQALRIAPEFQEAVIELAQILWEQNRPADAELELHRLLQRRPKDVEARTMLGTLKSARGRWEEAEREFRAAMEDSADGLTARKLLAFALARQEKFDEAAQHLELLRQAEPTDPGAYASLFDTYARLGRREQAQQVLRDLIKNVPGSEAANRARITLEEIAKNPDGYWEGNEKLTPELLISRLGSKDVNTQARALSDMRKFEWTTLPPEVYRLLASPSSPAAVRRNAVLLMGEVADPRTLPVLEILLFHPAERDPDAGVRGAVAHAISLLPTDAIIPIMYRALDDGDRAIREAGVDGIARRTGKSFRADISRWTPPEEWPAEREKYSRWWGSPSGSLAKYDGANQMREAFSKLKRGRERLGEYAVIIMDDLQERTWRAGYALFVDLTGKSFGAESGSVSLDERRRVTAEARRWLSTYATGGR